MGSMLPYMAAPWILWVMINYPLVNVYIALERSTMLLMGKSTISTGPFSIAMLVHQRVSRIVGNCIVLWEL